MLAGRALAGPPCRTAFEQPEFAFAAGCLAVADGRVLVVRQSGSGKLSIPGGFARPREGAQCTAHRETWEETGIDVVVHGLRVRFDNGFALYDCRVEGARGGPERLPVPDKAAGEVAEVLWIDPRDTEPAQWRFPRQLPRIQKLVNDAAGEPVDE